MFFTSACANLHALTFALDHVGVSVEMDALKKGWFSEVNGLWPGQAMSLEVEEVLHSEKSQFQDIFIFQRSSIALLFAALSEYDFTVGFLLLCS